MNFFVQILSMVTSFFVSFYTLELSDDDDLPNPNHQKKLASVKM